MFQRRLAELWMRRERDIRASDVVEVIAKRSAWRLLVLRAFSSHHPHSLPVAERELVVQSILSGDAGFAVLEVAAIAVCPSPSIGVHIAEAAKGRFGRLSRTHIKFSKQRNIVRKRRLQAKFSTCRRHAQNG
jgi:hypothetical protein